VDDVEILEEFSPPGVFVPDRVCEPTDDVVRFGDQGAGVLPRLVESAGPQCKAILGDVVVEEGVCVGTAVVASPAVDVERRDRRCIRSPSAPVSNKIQLGHDILLIDPGIGTAL